MLVRSTSERPGTAVSMVAAEKLATVAAVSCCVSESFISPNGMPHPLRPRTPAASHRVETNPVNRGLH